MHGAREQINDKGGFYMLKELFDLFEAKRIEKGLTVRETAKLAEISEATYRNLNKGRSTRTSADTLRAISIVLGVPLATVFELIGDGEPSPIIADLQETNQLPATTQELDTGLAILVNLMERNNETYAAALRARDEKFEQALDALDEQFAKALESKEAQFERERSALLETIHNKDKWIRWEFTLMCLLIAFICIILLIDVLHPEIGWIRRTFMDLFTRNIVA